MKKQLIKVSTHLHMKFYVQSEVLQLILLVSRLVRFAQLLMRVPL